MSLPGALERTGMGAVLLFCALVSFGWALAVPAHPISDAADYHAAAQRMADGKTYDSDLKWPVGYPAFLGLVFVLFGKSLLAARLANALVYVGITALTYHLAARWFNSKRIGKISALLLTVYVGLVGYISLTMSELLFTFLLLSGLACLERRAAGWLCAAGISFGLATLVRPQVLLVPAAVLIVRGWQQRPRSATKTLSVLLAVYAVLAAVTAPWIYHASQKFDRFVLVSTNSGINLLIGNNPAADGSYKVDETIRKIQREHPGDAAYRDRVYFKIATHYIVSHPVKTALRFPAKLFNFFRDEVSAYLMADRLGSSRTVILAGIAQLEYMAVIVWSGLGLYRCFFRSGSRPDLTGLIVFLYFTVMVLIFFGASRFRIPVMPLMIMFAAVYVEFRVEQGDDRSLLNGQAAIS